MKHTLFAAAAIAVSALAATPAIAAKPGSDGPGPIVDPCSAAYVQGAIACQGYYGGNLITGGTGSATTADENTIINLLLTGTASTSDNTPTNNTGAYNPPYTLSSGTVLGALTNLNGSATFNFGSLSLSGLTILGAHFGNNTDSDQNNVTAFWLLDLGSTPTHTITLSNGMGSSNAQIFATGGHAVPEPATWAMMLIGFGGMGMAMRRTSRRSAALPQVA
jgi:PEP-CTERM motif